MKYTLIRKSDAVVITGLSVEELDREVRSSGVGNAFRLLPTGAKLFTRKVGAVVRFGIYGYSPDGSDVDKALAMLAPA